MAQAANEAEFNNAKAITNVATYERTSRPRVEEELYQLTWHGLVYTVRSFETLGLDEFTLHSSKPQKPIYQMLERKND